MITINLLANNATKTTLQIVDNFNKINTTLSIQNVDIYKVLNNLNAIELDCYTYKLNKCYSTFLKHLQ